MSPLKRREVTAYSSDQKEPVCRREKLDAPCTVVLFVSSRLSSSWTFLHGSFEHIDTEQSKSDSVSDSRHASSVLSSLSFCLSAANEKLVISRQTEPAAYLAYLT